MLTGAPPSDRVSASPSPRRRVWPWAAGSIVITLAVIVATLVGHRLAAQQRLASQVMPAPALPPLAVEALIHAPGAIASLALDASTHTLVAQIAPRGCPHIPIRCEWTPTNQSGVAFYDSATGALRSQTLTSASDTQFTLTDPAHGVTYLIEPKTVTIFSDATGKQTGAYRSPMGANAQAAAIDPQTGVIYTLDASNTLKAYSGSDGQLMASAKAPAGSASSQLLFDADTQRVYIYASGGDQPATLAAFSASDLSPLGSWHIPQLSSGQFVAGPLDAQTHMLYLFGPDGHLWRIDLFGLSANGAGQTVHPQQVQSPVGVNGLGVTGALLVPMWSTSATNAGVEALNPSTGQPYAALPLIHPVAGGPTPLTLPIDTISRLAYLPGDDDTILIVSLAPPTTHAAPSLLTAEVMARAAMSKLLPDTNQNPPFVAAQTFPLGMGTVQRQYFIHYSDLGWKGPYAGTASVKEGGAPASQIGHELPGEYVMTFSITWNQLFLRQHSWTVQVTPDGRVHLLADSGDAIP